MPRRPFSVLAASASPPGMAISISTSPVVAMRRGDFGDGRAHHLPRHRIDGGLARRERKAGPRDRADAFAGAEDDAAPDRAAPHRGEDQRAVRHVGVVAGVLHHARRRGAIAACRGGEGEGGTAAARQGHLDRIGKGARQQRRVGRLGGCRGAGAGGPAAAEGACVSCHAPRYRAPRALVTAGGRRHDRARADRRRAALGRRQDHGDACAARGAQTARDRGASRQGRPRLYRSRLSCSGDRARRASISTAGR